MNLLTYPQSLCACCGELVFTREMEAAHAPLLDIDPLEHIYAKLNARDYFDTEIQTVAKADSPYLVPRVRLTKGRR